jgi:hypothetical protein
VEENLRCPIHALFQALRGTQVEPPNFPYASWIASSYEIPKSLMGLGPTVVRGQANIYKVI